MASPFEAEKIPERQPERTRKIREAMAWLQGVMAGGARSATEVEAEAISAGIAHTTLAVARARLSIRWQRQGNGWVWIPPKSRKKQPGAM